MSYTIPPGTPKAIKAAAFGRELVTSRALRRTAERMPAQLTVFGDVP